MQFCLETVGKPVKILREQGGISHEQDRID